jgi:hypothetical protein
VSGDIVKLPLVGGVVVTLPLVGGVKVERDLPSWSVSEIFPKTLLVLVSFDIFFL